ncbi:hypothetical protein [Hyunsoonleella pacifica]|uniref:Alpha-L-arabinofuranosidase n=1 Tax=Hyunsoonleella pacifica TaxID=1080224 RepID=A0A4Q9FW55_9FLAO|nr:hypothetical protein [Hyunsoonleella pacifica]TBN18662.1 hypothetical protein EYD46_00930 [Hyunsoonleella pacifica]GGD03642.1 hypothetical protein GCM10011368_01850 [Hyunsoonleella pacifica]
MIKIRKTLVFILMGLVMACSTSNPTDPNDPKFDDIDDDPIGGGPANADITLTADATDAVDIYPDIFGINNDWRQIPDNTFSNFASTLGNIGTTVVRYPGGWESEFYAWESNTTPGWDNTPTQPGASVETLKSNISNYSVVLPTTEAMNRAVGSSQFNTAIANLKAKVKLAIDMSNIDDGLVEIGNEWWLQWAGGVSREQKLDKYVNIAMELAEYIDNEYPNRKFKLLINGDYTQPQEFTAMKNKFTKGYDAIDGVGLHTYTGYDTDTHNIADLEERIKDCADNFNSNKNFKYLSEWMPSRDYNNRALYMEAANIIPDIIHIYARAESEAAAFWPPINSSIPGLGLTNWNYSKVFPTGQILGEMANSYKGKALKTTSDKFHLAAAQQDDSTIVLFITGGNESGKKVAVKLKGFTVTSIQSVERYVPADYNDTAKAEPYLTETASAEISSDNEVVVDVNKQGLYQIYKIVVKGN